MFLKDSRYTKILAATVEVLETSFNIFHQLWKRIFWVSGVHSPVYNQPCLLDEQFTSVNPGTQTHTFTYASTMEAKQCISSIWQLQTSCGDPGYQMGPRRQQAWFSNLVPPPELSWRLELRQRLSYLHLDWRNRRIYFTRSRKDTILWIIVFNKDFFWSSRESMLNTFNPSILLSKPQLLAWYGSSTSVRQPRQRVSVYL